MIVLITSVTPKRARSPPQSAPVSAPAALPAHSTTVIASGRGHCARWTPQAVAASAPASNCPSAPIFHIAPENATLTAKPVKISGVVFTRVSVAASQLPKAPLSVEHLARALRQTAGKRPVSLTHLPLSWVGEWWTFRHPLDYLGSDGGGGVGGGPGISIGAALALKGSGRLPVAICGDGDFLMGVTAVWTAVHYKIPLLFVLANNRSFYNDELHQERMARTRNRPVENKWIGQRMSEPEVDLAAMGRAQGAVGFGPITKTADLATALEKAIAEVDAGRVAVVDVRVEPGYTAVMTQAMTRAGN